MRKGIITVILAAITILTFAQSQHITSAAIILKQYNSEKDKSVKVLKIKEAKEFIDKAYDNESTSNEPKMWMYRAKIYKMIAINHDSLDSDAIFKATESHLKCMQPHPKKKDKIMIYKKWPKEEVLEGLVQCGYQLFNRATEEYNSENYKNSLKYYTAIFEIMPFDEEDQLKRGNITKETILYRSFLSTNKMKDNAKSKELLQQLIDINFNEPAIYIQMSNIFLEEGNTDKALEYLTSGRDVFEGDQGLINTEIDLYLKLGKSDELIEKLSNAIELDPENDIFYVIRGTCYQNNNKIEKAINDYNTALEINPEQITALNNISSCFLKQTDPIVKKMNNLSLSQTSKFNKLKLDLKNLYLKTLPYVKKYLELKPNDKSILNVLAEIYTKLEMYEEAKEVKGRITQLK